MFHTSIDVQDEKSPIKALQLLLYASISGIGILPQPGRGASDSELFDVSVMGARKNAQAPYKVTGIENFGRADMRKNTKGVKKDLEIQNRPRNRPMKHHKETC